MDGVLGCQKPGLAAGDCFGLQPDLTLRIAVVDVSGKTLLIWERTAESASDADKAANVQTFEDMLATVRFSNRPVQTAEPGQASVIDGVWTATWTRDELAAYPLLNRDELYDDLWGNSTLSLKEGQGNGSIKNVTREARDSFTYQVKGDMVTFDRDSGERSVMRWSLVGDQLVFKRDASLGTGPTVYVIRPWTRQTATGTP